MDNLWSVEIVASVAEGLQELSPASDDRKRAGPRMETLGATRPEEVRILELE